MSQITLTRIEAHHFPADTPAQLEARLAGYIAEGQAAAGDRPNAEAAALAYAYHLAYASIASRLAVQHASVQLDGAARTTAAHQVAHFQGLADEHLAEFRRLTAPAPANMPRASRATPIRFTW